MEKARRRAGAATPTRCLKSRAELAGSSAASSSSPAPESVTPSRAEETVPAAATDSDDDDDDVVTPGRSRSARAARVAVSDDDDEPAPAVTPSRPAAPADPAAWLAFADDDEEDRDPSSPDPSASRSPAPRRGKLLRRSKLSARKRSSVSDDEDGESSQGDEDDALDESNIIDDARPSRTSRRLTARERIEQARKRRRLGSDDSPAPDAPEADSVVVLSDSDDDAADADSPVDEDAAMDGFIVSDEDEDGAGATPGTVSVLPLSFQNLDSFDWYRLFLRYLARLALDPRESDRLQSRAGSNDDPLASAFRKIKTMLDSRAQNMYSSVWSAQLLQTIKDHPTATRSGNSATAMCETCNRSERNACARITFHGRPYDRATFVQLAAPERDSSSSSSSDSDSEPEPEPKRTPRRHAVIASDSDSDSNSPPPASRPSSISPNRAARVHMGAPSVSAGRYCALRVVGFHALEHYVYHTLSRVRAHLRSLAVEHELFRALDAIDAIDAGECKDETVQGEAEKLLGVFPDEDWAAGEFERFEGALEEADDVLSNRVGAMERTSGGGSRGYGFGRRR
ncbi:hypothetical protein H9P43_007677 [Blastocladiella emersonii ATCC 22665]|nr:hypothetical protein H9P43_007677 [Blastocladiella emersonii ATCC 22665]